MLFFYLICIIVGSVDAGSSLQHGLFHFNKDKIGTPGPTKYCRNIGILFQAISFYVGIDFSVSSHPGIPHFAVNVTHFNMGVFDVLYGRERDKPQWGDYHPSKYGSIGPARAADCLQSGQTAMARIFDQINDFCLFMKCAPFLLYAQSLYCAPEIFSPYKILLLRNDFGNNRDSDFFGRADIDPQGYEFFHQLMRNPKSFNRCGILSAYLLEITPI